MKPARRNIKPEDWLPKGWMDRWNTVEKDAVHASIEEWLAFPEVFSINQEVEHSQEEESKA